MWEAKGEGKRTVGKVSVAGRAIGKCIIKEQTGRL
jgi:hypothetical protein